MSLALRFGKMANCGRLSRLPRATRVGGFIPDSFETKQVSAELHVERIRDAGRQCLRSPVSPAPTLPRVRASHTADIKLGLKVKRLVKAAAGEVVGRKISANFLRVSIAYIIVYSMHATIYGRGQMVIPAKARKEARIDTGDVVNVLPEGDGRLVLVRMERPKPRRQNKVRVIRRKGKHSLLSIGRTISREEVFKALEQFPP